MEIFKWLNEREFVNSYIVRDFRESSLAYYLNLQVNFIDGSVLYAREYVEEGRRKYSFHWQDHAGHLLVRWDNAPHFPDLLTHPHHKHVGASIVVESFDISLEEVFAFIHAQLAKA